MSKTAYHISRSFQSLIEASPEFKTFFFLLAITENLETTTATPQFYFVQTVKECLQVIIIIISLHDEYVLGLLVCVLANVKQEETKPCVYCHKVEAKPCVYCHKVKAKPCVYCHKVEAKPCVLSQIEGKAVCVLSQIRGKVCIVTKWRQSYVCIVTIQRQSRVCIVTNSKLFQDIPYWFLDPL